MVDALETYIQNHTKKWERSEWYYALKKIPGFEDLGSSEGFGGVPHIHCRTLRLPSREALLEVRLWTRVANEKGDLTQDIEAVMNARNLSFVLIRPFRWDPRWTVCVTQTSPRKGLSKGIRNTFPPGYRTVVRNGKPLDLTYDLDAMAFWSWAIDHLFEHLSIPWATVDEMSYILRS